MTFTFVRMWQSMHQTLFWSRAIVTNYPHLPGAEWSECWDLSAYTETHEQTRISLLPHMGRKSLKGWMLISHPDLV